MEWRIVGRGPWICGIFLWFGLVLGGCGLWVVGFARRDGDGAGAGVGVGLEVVGCVAGPFGRI